MISIRELKEKLQKPFNDREKTYQLLINKIKLENDKSDYIERVKI